MDVKTFLKEFIAALADTNFVEDIDLKSEGIIINGRVVLAGEMFLNVYYNEITETIAFALIKNEKRIWGIDKDSIRDWHIHPLNDPEQHESIQPVTIFDIIGKLKNILKN